MKKYVLIGLIALAGCQTSAPQNKSNGEKIRIEFESITQAQDSLTTIISDKSCDASYQCKVLHLGERACGGASHFEIYSTKTANQEEVEHIATQITDFEKRYNQKENSIDTCQHTITPQTLCIKSTCEQVELR